MNFHQKSVVYFILDYFRILFILDINSVLREFILWDQRLSKGYFVKKIVTKSIINEMILILIL